MRIGKEEKTHANLWVKRLVWKMSLVLLASVLAAIALPLIIIFVWTQVPFPLDIFNYPSTWFGLGAYFIMIFSYLVIRFREDNWGGMWVDGPEDADFRK